MSRPTNRQAEPEVWFRIVHSAVPRENSALWEPYREQEVEVTFGTIDMDILKRRIEADQGVRVLPPTRSILKPTGPKTLRVNELLNKAMEWQRQLDAGEIQNKTEIARREGITRARVNQVMSLLRLAPEFRKQILTMSDIIRTSAVTERRLRPFVSGTEQARHGGSSASLMP